MNKKNYLQRKRTLKWKDNGDLSEIDMLRILEKLSTSELNQWDLPTIPNKYKYVQ